MTIKSESDVGFKSAASDMTTPSTGLIIVGVVELQHLHSCLAPYMIEAVQKDRRSDHDRRPQEEREDEGKWKDKNHEQRGAPDREREHSAFYILSYPHENLLISSHPCLDLLDGQKRS